MIGTLAYDTKEEVMGWMLDIQLGRRNLSPIQRIAVAEKYRPIYERQALVNKQFAIQEARKNNKKNKSEQILVNLPKTEPINTSEKLADIAGVSEKTYRMGAKVLNSDNEDIKQRVLSGETSISAGYKELTQDKKTEPSNTNGEINNIPSTTTVTKPPTPKTQISDEVKQICADFGEYRLIYERQTQNNQSKAGGYKKSENYQKTLTENLPQAISIKERNLTTDKKLSDIAGV